MKYIKLFERFENVLFKGDDIKNFRAGEQLFFSTLKFHIDDYVRSTIFPNEIFYIDSIDLADSQYTYHLTNIDRRVKQSPSLQYSGPFSLHSDHFDKECNLTRLEDYEVSAIKYNL